MTASGANWAQHLRSFQLLSVDGAVVGLLHRFLDPKNRLTLFHYCFVPLTVISSVPIIVACCIARLPYLVSPPSVTKPLRPADCEYFFRYSTE